MDDIWPWLGRPARGCLPASCQPGRRPNWGILRSRERPAVRSAPAGGCHCRCQEAQSDPARNVHFISGLIESGVDFVAADNPHANKLMVHMLAAFAEHEREQISQRTKDALAAAKARGIRLGRNAADRLAPAYRAEAIERARKLAPLLAELKSAGLSVRQMASELTAREAFRLRLAHAGM